MSDILHLYELFFFGVVVAIIYLLALPEIKKFIADYSAKQKEEQDRVRHKKNDLMEECKKESALSSAADQKWNDFIYQSKNFRSKLELIEEKNNKHKIELIKKMEEKILKDSIIKKQNEILMDSLGKIKTELAKIAKSDAISFDTQISEISKYLKAKN